MADFDVATGFMAHQARLSVRTSRGRTEKEDSLAVARRLQSQRRRPFPRQEDHVVAWYKLYIETQVVVEQLCFIGTGLCT